MKDLEMMITVIYLIAVMEKMIRDNQTIIIMAMNLNTTHVS